MNTPITSEQAQAYMTAMIGVSPSRYHEAVQSVITKHDVWTEPLIDLVLNAEDIVTATLLKINRGGVNALEWAVSAKRWGIFEDLLGYFSFGIDNGSSITLQAYKSVMKDLFTPKLVHAMTTDPLEYEQAISMMDDHDISWVSIAACDSIPVEALDRDELAMTNIMEAMSAFVGACEQPSQRGAHTADDAPVASRKE